MGVPASAVAALAVPERAVSDWAVPELAPGPERGRELAVPGFAART